MTTHTLRVARVENPTANSKAIYFEPTSLPAAFAGQFLTLIVRPNDKELRRAYSLFTTPEEGLAIGIKRVPGGIVSNYLNTYARAGMEIQVAGPSGNFTYRPEKNTGAKHLILVGGGSGITPLMAILKTALAQQQVEHITLLYANTCEQEIMFAHELNALAEAHREKFTLIHYLNSENTQQIKQRPKGLLGWLGKTTSYTTAGFLTQEKALEIFKQHNIAVSNTQQPSTYAYLCGPGGFMTLAEQALLNIGVAPTNIKKENFVASAASNPTPNFTPPNCEARVKIAGDYKRFTVPSGKNILQAAIDANIDWPFSCREGSCTACYSRCTSGQVYLLSDSALSNQELAEGGVLPCVGFPKSKKLELVID
ncbi:ferredoxin--NADP reductase [Saccharophagus degradans]|uniref:Ferredoxin--NADP reductase n=1 Tax=Saccharophagus degradans TaxID=86304 RepID=A0AAW7X6K1_9GAMM|nr:ferredoxin--NADP reductase [Saccharophagus degradans]MDO6422371.1 ferredoxin--NADP reductase [Saccharophagus degradans]MDO6608089.1 ferredoxin--NADP reductase [Saccharophagus degradans]